MDDASQFKKVGVIILGQHFCDQLEDIPIKKRISLRDSALYQPTLPTPSSEKVSDKNVVSSSLAQLADPRSLSKQQSDNLMTSPLDITGSRVVVLSSEKTVSSPDFPHTETPVDSTLNDRTSTLDSAYKFLSTEAVPTCTDTALSSASSFVSDAKRDTKGDEHVKHLTSDITGDSSTGGISSFQPDPPCNDHIAVQSVNQEVRILWDLNVAMDEWEKPIDHQSVESQDRINSFVNIASTKFDKSDDITSSGENLMPSIDAHLTAEGLNSDSMSLQCHINPEPAYSLGCESVSNSQHVSNGNCRNRNFSNTKSSLATDSMNISCNQNPSFETDKHLTPALCESETTSYCAESTKLPKCEDKNIATTGESSDGDNDSSKSKNSKSDQLEVTVMDYSDNCMDLLKQSTYVDEGNHLETLTKYEKNAALVHHPCNGVTKRLSENVDVFVEPLCVPGKCKQDATVLKQVVNIDKCIGDQTEQDYEDGELRDPDIHCWKETEIEMGETGCLDYEPIPGNTENLDESSTFVSVGENYEDQLKRKKLMSFEILKNQLAAKDGTISDKKMTSGSCSKEYFENHYSNRQLDRKLSGWDRLPKDDHASSDKVQNVYRVSSRILSSELQGFTGEPPISEDAEEKKIVLERRIRQKEAEHSYSMESDSSIQKYRGNRRSTPHMHGRNLNEYCVSEHRSTVKHRDIYDSRSGYRPLIKNSKNLEGHRNRSPSFRNEAFDAHINYSRNSRGRHGRHAEAEGSDRGFRGDMNRYRGSLTDDCAEEDLCARQPFLKGDRSYSPRANPHCSDNFSRPRARSRTRSPPMWLRSPRYERMSSRDYHRSTEFGADDRVTGTRSPFRKSSFRSDNYMHYGSPPRGGFIPHNKPRRNNEDDDFNIKGPRDRSPVRRFPHKVNVDAAYSRAKFKGGEDFRPMGYRGRGRMCEISPSDKVRGYAGGSDSRNREYSFEAGHQKHF